ncbi:MAG: methyltransferase domain-containing protein [Pseudomonadota bacterium]
MQITRATESIAQRYSELASSSCCLSCGGAIDLAQPRPGEVCVDLGSGRGQDVIRLAEAVGPTGLAYGVDVAEGMLATARRTAEKLGVTNARFVRCELEQLDLPARTADLVISNCTINHAGDKKAVWAEIFRVLKPGGRFVVSDIYATEEVPAAYRNDPVAVAECWAGAVTRDAYLETLVDSGFNSVQVLEESAPYAKGHIQVCSITLAGTRPASCGCHGGS